MTAERIGARFLMDILTPASIWASADPVEVDATPPADRDAGHRHRPANWFRHRRGQFYGAVVTIGWPEILTMVVIIPPPASA